MKGAKIMPGELYLRGLLAWNENLLKDNFISHLPVNMVNDIGKDNIQNYVLLKCAELEVLIPSPTEMALALNSWASINERLFSIIYDIELAISTTEGEKTETITRDRKGKSTTEDKENLTQKSESGTSGSDSTTEKVAGFNSTSLVDRGSTTITYGGKANYDEKNDNTKNSKNETTEAEKETRSTGMSELEVLDFKLEKSMSALSKITELFKEEFFLVVY